MVAKSSTQLRMTVQPPHGCVPSSISSLLNTAVPLFACKLAPHCTGNESVKRANKNLIATALQIILKIAWRLTLCSCSVEQQCNCKDARGSVHCDRAVSYEIQDLSLSELW